eukprot:5144461-Prymnesium_polylepis.1
MSFNSRPIEEPQVLPVNDAVRIEHSSVGGQAGPQPAGRRGSQQWQLAASATSFGVQKESASGSQKPQDRSESDCE